jgi:RNA polymerase sigma-70 factor, ECF subfamily
MEAMALYRALLDALPPALRQRLAGEPLERLVQARADAARAAWAPLDVPDAELARFWAERVPDVAASHEAVAALALEELYLVCGCARGEMEALRLFEARYGPAVRASLARMRLGADVIDELLQRLRARLFVDGGDGRPGIVAFAGRGALASWLSVSAVRDAYKLLQRETRERPDEDERLADLPARERDQEAKLARRDYGAAFRKAFAEALMRLADREKNLLRQHYLDGLTLDQLGALHRTHRTTIARWVASARQRLLDGTRDQLVRQLRIPRAECDSIIRAAQSQFDLTLHRLLAARRR